MNKLILLFIILFASPLTGHAQKNTDLGVFGGANYYMGDINHGRPFYKPGMAVGPVVRYNFNPRYALRMNGIYVAMSGDDLDFDNVFQQNRKANFKTDFIDFNLQFEFHFRPYKIYERKDRWSPYLTGGAGYTYVLNSVNSTRLAATNSVILSYGGGIKLTLHRRLAGGIEFTYRKSFSDGFDGINNAGSANDEFNTFFHNKDWYSLVGIFITYKFWEYLEDCPAYD